MIHVVWGCEGDSAHQIDSAKNSRVAPIPPISWTSSINFHFVTVSLEQYTYSIGILYARARRV